MIWLLFANLRVVAADCDTTIDKHAIYKLSHHHFLDKYGKDDTAKTIINYYFEQHSLSKTLLVVDGCFVTITGWLSLVVLQASPGLLSALFAILVIPNFAAFVLCLAPILFFFWHFNRRRLWKDLNRYLFGDGISNRLRKDLKFQKSKQFRIL
jgi:hypothetical protein